MSRSLFFHPLARSSLIRLRLCGDQSIDSHKNGRGEEEAAIGSTVIGGERERQGKAERGDDDDDVCLELSAAQLHKTRLDGEEKHERMRGKGYISKQPSLPDA